MTSHRDKFESALRSVMLDRKPDMTRDELDATLHDFRSWRTRPENKEYVQDIEYGAELGGPEWRERVKMLADQFYRRLAS